MDEDLAARTGRYISAFVCSILSLLAWIVILVFVDDTGLWHLEQSGWLSDIIRFGIVIFALVLASGLGYSLHRFFMALWGPKRSPSDFS